MHGVLLSQVMHQQNKLGIGDKSTAPLEQQEAQFGFFTGGRLEGDNGDCDTCYNLDGDHA